MSAKRHDQQECFDILVKAQSSLVHRNIANQTIQDIPGNVEIDKYFVDNSSYQEQEVTTEEDALSLLDEAQRKLNLLKK